MQKVELLLIRYLATDTETMGKLYVDGKYFCETLEDAIRLQKVKSYTCIPFRGDYKVRTTNSPRFKRPLPLVWNIDSNQSVTNVNGDRWDGIRFHGGNHHLHTDGCVLVAKNAYVGKPNKFTYGGKTHNIENWIQGSVIDQLIKLIGSGTASMRVVHSHDFKDNRKNIDQYQPTFSRGVPGQSASDLMTIHQVLGEKMIPIALPITYNEAFENAVKKFQSLYMPIGTDVNGKVDRPTLAAMGLIWDGYNLIRRYDHLTNKPIIV